MTSTTIDLPSNYQMPQAQNTVVQSIPALPQTMSTMTPGILLDRQQSMTGQQFLQQVAPQNAPGAPVINGQSPATTNFTGLAIPQTPMMQAQAQAQSQQSALQQQMLMQQQLQQQAFQQRMMANQPQVQTSTVQMPVQSANATPVNHPAVVQYR